MLHQIKGLHHVTSMASDANENNRFFTETLGLRRVKTTVNFDAPDVYHLYYGDAAGSPGSVMTYFPFPHMSRGQAGHGEVGVTEFAVPIGALDYWKARLAAAKVEGLVEEPAFGAARIVFNGPDGERFALVEEEPGGRTPWTGADVSEDVGIFGFKSVRLRLQDGAATEELLQFMGYERSEKNGALTRYAIDGGNGADVIEIEEIPDARSAGQGTGSVHHIAFAVLDRSAQLEVRNALLDTGYQVTPVIDRNYFWAIYFRTPGGVLFEVATDDPGFAHDEPFEHLGQSLKLPPQYEARRDEIERALPELIV